MPVMLSIESNVDMPFSDAMCFMICEAGVSSSGNNVRLKTNLVRVVECKQVNGQQRGVLRGVRLLRLDRALEHRR